MKVKEPELETLVAREYRYDHFAVHSPEYGFPEGEKASQLWGLSEDPGTEEGREPVFGAQSSLMDRWTRTEDPPQQGFPAAPTRTQAQVITTSPPPHSRVSVPVLGQAQAYVGHPGTQRVVGRASLFCFQDKPYIQGPGIHRTSTLRGPQPPCPVPLCPS